MRRQKPSRRFVVRTVESAFRTTRNLYEVIDTETGRIEDCYASYKAALSDAVARNRNSGGDHKTTPLAEHAQLLTFTRALASYGCAGYPACVGQPQRCSPCEASAWLKRRGYSE
jgi:hypothetical protein